MNIAYYALKILGTKARAFERATKDPALAQKKILSEILLRNQNTEYGKEYAFSGIKSREDYQKQIPLNSYETLRPYMEKMTKGINSILTSDKPIFFSITSGSSGKPKLVPVTKHSSQKKSDVTDLWAYYIYRDHPKVLNGKVLAIVSPEIDGYTECGLPYGAESGHGYKHLTPAIRSFYALPYEVFEIKNYDARYYAILRIAAEQNITTIATMTPSTIILLCQRLDDLGETLADDIEKGMISAKFDISKDIREKIEKPLKANPEKASFIRAVLKEKKSLFPKYIWPELELIECWKRGTEGLYLKEFPKYFGDVPVRDFGYFSSEARSSIPMSDAGAGGVLAINANFYEFIPKEDIDKKKKRILFADQLEKDREYFIVITSPGGLYRYNIDDLIRVDGFFNKTPVIEFVQKGTNVTSVTGEKLYESQVVEALEKASSEKALSIKFFSATIEFGKLPRYVFLVEFNKNLSHEVKREFLKSVDHRLSGLNEEYEFNRNSQELGKPVLKVVRAGGFQKFREKRVKEGMHDSQFKIPKLTSDREFHKKFDIEEEITMD